jgi:Predicted exonuclease of the beta-lactamase fold involved in RNA processing
MRFINLTRQTEIGANSYLLEIAGRKIVLDAGLHPRKLAEEALPSYRLIPDGSVSSIFVSHAHQDHIGSLPLLMRRQPQARVFMTEATAKLSEIMLHNSVNVMTRQREDLGLATYPLFTHRETEEASAVWQKAQAGQRWSLEGERVPNDENENSFEFFEAGHILGAIGILFRSEGKRIFYTGDVNFSDQSLVLKAAFPEEPLDVLVIETTRGDRAADPEFSRRSEEDRFLEAILGAFERGGSVLVPVFALGKTQEVLTMLHRFRMNGALLNTPVFIGGLSTKVTIVHDQLAGSTRRLHPGLQLLPTVAPQVLNGLEGPAGKIQSNGLYVLSSGMMTEKTLSNRLAARFIGDRKQSIFFVGYADPESPAGRLKAAKRGETIQLDEDLPKQSIDCSIDEFNFSGHASRESLLEYIQKTKPKVLILVHGDPPSIQWFARVVETSLPETRVIVPEPGRSYNIE